MVPLLSIAWWGQLLAGPAAKALGETALVISVFMALGGGLLWLRDDAKQQEAAAWQVKLANARTQQLNLRLAALRKAETIRRATDVQLEHENDVLGKSVVNLVGELEKRTGQCNGQGRVICYPRAVAPELNK